MIKIKKQLITAVDIGSYSIKLVQIESQNKIIKIKNKKSIICSQDLIKYGKIKDSEKAGEYLKKLFVNLDKNNLGKLVTTFSNYNLVIRNIKIPLMSDEDLKQLMELGISDYIPYSKEDIELKYIKTAQDQKNIEIMLIAVKKEILKSFLTPWENINFKIDSINIQPMALISLLEYNFTKNGISPLIIIDIGFRNTSLVIGDFKKIFLLRNIDVGTYDFIKKYKLKSDTEDIGKENGETELIFDNQIYILKSVYKKIIKEIQYSLEFYNLKGFKNKIDQLYLTGGGANIPGIKNMLEDCLESYIKINFLPGIEKNLKKEFSVALGLAVGEVLTG